jgi:methyl-accepting chemotaxis protein
MKFKTRILMLPAITLALLAASWVASSSISTTTSAHMSALGTINYPYLEGVTKFDGLVSQTTQTIQAAVAEGDNAKLDDVNAVAESAQNLLTSLGTIAGKRSSVQQLSTAYRHYQQAATTAAKAMLSKQQSDIASNVAHMQSSQQALNALVAHELKAAHEDVGNLLQTSRDGLQHIQDINVAFSVAMLASLVTGALLILRALKRELGEDPEQLRVAATRIAGGELTSDCVYGEDDHSIAATLGRMSGKLTGIVREIRGASAAVGASSGQLSEGNDDLSQRTQEQAASLEQTASSVEQMTATIKHNAENARQADQLAQDACAKAMNGGDVVADAIASMDGISQASQKIEAIIGVINEIAFQTNLLALNAAVEAAHAGEHGRGFSVVASEVRNLAKRSAQAAKEVKELIADSAEKVRTGTDLVNRSGQTLTEIVRSVRRVTDIVAEIAAASDEQSTGIDQINRAMTQMDSVTQQNAALVEEAAATSRSMLEQARQLEQQVAYFRLSDTPDTGQPMVAAIVPLRASTPSHKPSSVTSAKILPLPYASVAQDAEGWRSF